MGWTYYVNGILANRGALEYILHEGDVERWDYHEWSYLMFIPAIIGDYPEPFLHGIGGRRLPTIIVYGSEEFTDDAEEIESALIKLGVEEISIRSRDNLGDSEKEVFQPYYHRLSRR